MSYFPTYSSVNIGLNSYSYDPLLVVLEAYRELKQTQSIDSLNAEIIKKCKKVINRFISGKEACLEDIEYIRELCKKKKTNTCRLLYRSIQFIEFSKISSQVFESIYLNYNIDHAHIFVESIEHWKIYEEVINRLGLEGVFTAICKEELRKKYFKNPIIFFALPQWVQSELITPPSGEVYFIYPLIFEYKIKTDDHITSNGGKSLEFLSIETEVKRANFEFKAESKFYDLFPKDLSFNENISVSLEAQKGDFERDPIRTLNVNITSGHKLVAHKTYLTVMSNNRLIFSCFDSERDLAGVKYIVSSIDASGATTQSLLNEQLAVMNVWKKPLRDNLKKRNLIDQLKVLGAEKANEQNVKNWADPDRIAPRSENDFRAVLKFAGISDEEDIKNYLYLAYKQRGDSISVGHKRSFLANEIIKRNIQEKIINGELMPGEYFSHGIRFQIDGVYIL